MRQRGFSLIEVMIVVVIVAILVVAGIPSISDWLQNSRTRSVAESLQNGIRFAQGEAARVARLTRLSVTTSPASWQVDVVQLAGSSAPIDTLVSTTLQKSPGGNLDFVTITPNSASNTVLQFNDLGRVSAAASSVGPFTALTADAIFTVTNSKGARKLQVRVSPSGKVRQCDPDRAFSTTNPDGCS